MTDRLVNAPPVVTPEEWENARQQLLTREISGGELSLDTHRGDHISANTVYEAYFRIRVRTYWSKPLKALKPPAHLGMSGEVAHHPTWLSR